MKKYCVGCQVELWVVSLEWCAQLITEHRIHLFAEAFVNDLTREHTQLRLTISRVSLRFPVHRFSKVEMLIERARDSVASSGAKSQFPEMAASSDTKSLPSLPNPRPDQTHPTPSICFWSISVAFSDECTLNCQPIDLRVCVYVGGSFVEWMGPSRGK